MSVKSTAPINITVQALEECRGGISGAPVSALNNQISGPSD